MIRARAYAIVAGMDALNDTPRALDSAMMFGRIHSVDGDRCRVESGGIVTDAIRWFAARAGTTRRWSPPSVGEQVLLLSPGGDPAGGVALCGIYSDANPSPSVDPNEEVTEYPDGTRASYNHETHALTITIAQPGEVEITAKRIRIVGDVDIVGDLSVDGDASATGTITGETDVVGDGVSLKTHVHGGVQSGGSQSGPPT